MYEEGMAIGQITNMMLSELAPHLDEVYAYVFEQIDATSATPEEAQAKKKGFLAKHWKGMLGTAAALGATGYGASRLATYGSGLRGGIKGEGIQGAIHNIKTGGRDLYSQGQAEVAKRFPPKQPAAVQ